MADLNNPSIAGAIAPAASPAAASQAAPALDAVALSQMFAAPDAAGAASQPDAPSAISAAAVAGSAAGAAMTPAVTPSATQPPASLTPPAAPLSLAQQAAELGIELPATATDADVFAAMRTRLQQVVPLAQYAQAILPHADQINEFFASRGAPPQAAALAAPTPATEQWSEEKHFQQHWNAPKLTPQMQHAINSGLVIRDPETGAMTAKPGFEVMVSPLLADLNHAINWERDAVRDFFQSNPLKKTYEALQDPIKRLVQAELDQRLQATRSQDMATQGVQQFEKANEEWLYQAAAGGGRMMTQQGQNFVGLVKELANNWTGDAATLLNLCKSAVGNVAAAAPASAATGKQAATAAATQANQQKQASFLQTALEQAAHQPSGGANFVQSPAGPVTVTQRELEDMFLNDYRAAIGAAA